MKLNTKRTILIGFAFFLISAFWYAYDAIVPLILTNHFGMGQFPSGIVMSLDNVFAIVMLPIFGSLSDKIMTRFGKRTPFIFIGTIAAALAFIALIAVDIWQLNAVKEAGLHIELQNLQEQLKLAQDAVRDAAASEVEAKKEIVKGIEEAIEVFQREKIFALTSKNLLPLIAFIAVLLVTLISMATFRSPAVALMPDITVKPLRSKGNAIINLMGTAGGIITLVLGMIFGTSKQFFMNYMGYILSVCGVMLLALILFILTVKENKWAKEMQDETKRLGIEEEDSDADSGSRKLSKGERASLILILASVALWYTGYNAVTSKYSVYATNELGMDFNIHLIIAQAAALISFVPLGSLASKIGRRRSILIGVSILTFSFLAAIFPTRDTPELILYILFATAGVGWAMINVNSFPMVVELAKGSDVGKYTGYYYTASMAAQIITPVLSGLLIDYTPLGWMVFFPYAALFVALSFVTMYFVKHGDSKPVKKSVLESLAGAEDD